MLKESSSLLAQNEGVRTKQNILDAFKERFIMSPNEVHYLVSSSEPVDELFFRLLDRVKRIHRDCEVLLGTENQRLGLELMEDTSRNLNNAFKKLYNWIQKEFKTLDLEDPHVSGSIRRALRVLAERPSLFQNCLDFFAEAREHTLSDAFHSALTAVPDASDLRKGSMKPIEFSTHDLLRYVGDMLAWAHSAAVSERESLEGLFISDGEELAKGLKAGKVTESWAQMQEEDGAAEEIAFDGRKALNDLVGGNMAGVARTLKQRVELAVQNHDDLLVVYKAKNLLQFYRGVFSKLVGDDSVLVSTIQTLQTSTYARFDELIAEDAIHATHETLPEDYSAPSFLLTALDRLASILHADSTNIHSHTAPDPQKPSSSNLLSMTLTPFLDHCTELGSSLPDSDPDSASSAPPLRTVFRLNCLLPVHMALAPYAPTPDLTDISSTISHLTAHLTAIQHTFFLHESNLSTLLSSISSSTTPLTPQILTQPAQNLDDFLPEALTDALDNIRFLSDKKLAKQVTEEAVERFCRDFEEVERKLEEMDENADAEEREEKETEGESEEKEDGEQKERRVRLRDVYPRTSGEVRVLLS
ncbi:MAG: hypothetical protein Q9227_009561 [Pyrenula ochraceoflavens]